jgi:hypothetical protein
MASICFFSSSVRYFSASFFSHSAGNVGFDHAIDRFQPFEHVAEHAIELVNIALVFHQGGARQIVEVVDAARRQIGVHGFQQRQIFAQGHRYAGCFELLEETDEHLPAFYRRFQH